jgi:hypothetical protein
MVVGESAPVTWTLATAYLLSGAAADYSVDICIVIEGQNT